MSRTMTFLAIAAALAAILSLAGCSTPTPPPVPTAVPTAVPTQAPTPASFTDPFAYCAAVVNIDSPDARYTGAKVPDSVIDGLMKAMQMPAGSDRAAFAARAQWRCMGGKVYGCNVGANIPCGEKANVDKAPTAEMKEFCTAMPSADVIPAAVTGRATVYSWRCTAGQPAIDKELTKPDARGFLTSFWYEVPAK